MLFWGKFGKGNRTEKFETKRKKERGKRKVKFKLKG
jgi:hypothetical protein